MKRKLNFNFKTNSIVCGDCEEWLKFIPSNSIDLIYIDPPFFSNKNYEIVWGNGFEVRSFGDRFAGGIRHYIEWMRPKIIEARRVLKDTGSILLHCDWHANHRLRCLLDDVFSDNNFQNEIVLHYTAVGLKAKANKFHQNTESIFYYTKQKGEHVWNQQYVDYSDPSQYRKASKHKWNSKTKKAERLRDENGNIKYFLVKNYKRDNLIELPALRGNEKVGYKTQKPEALLDILIKSCSNKNDMVLDFFGGGGTTAKVCADLGRRFITGDVSPVAIRVIADRLIANGIIEYDVKALPSTKKEYLLMGGHKFADIICEYMGWESNPKKTGDGGIDAWTNKRKIGIQIKNHKKKVGRPDIQKLVGSLTDYESGIFVAWEFSNSAYEYKAKYNARSKRKIDFIEVEEILGNLLLPHERRIKQQQMYEKRVKKSRLQPPRPSEQKEDRLKIVIQ